MKKIVLFDGQCHKSLLPLTFTRPVAHIRVGIFTILKKWENHFNQRVSVRCKEFLSERFSSFEDVADIGVLAGLLPDRDLADVILDLDQKTILMSDEKVLAICPLPENNKNIEDVLSDYKVIKYESSVTIIERPHDIFLQNGEQLKYDYTFLTSNRKSEKLNQSNTLIGNSIFIEPGAKISSSILNSNEGPIYIGKNAEIMEGCLIRGPFALMENSILKMGTKVYGPTTFGPYSKVGGEISNSVIQGFSNKAHDGYLGNSVIGEWCNLGADTNTSNLKNNYGSVKTWSYNSDSMLDTGTQYCGLTMGDHSKCGINTMFNTGTVVGVFANVFGGGFPSKFIPSFSWGDADGYVDYDIEKALILADLVMKRRDLNLSEEDKNLLETIYTLTAKYRISS